MSVAIETGIPIPAKRANGAQPGRKPTYPFATMNVGDSFAVPLIGEKYGRTGSDKATQRVMCAAANYKSRYGRDFATRVDADRGEVRCWRIA